MSRSASKAGQGLAPVLLSTGGVLGRRRRTPLRLLQQPIGAVSATVLLLLVVIALCAPLIAPYGDNQPTTVYFGSPSSAHLFGTDNLGRDMLSRVIFGARVSMEVGLLAVLIGTGAGSLLGLLTGFFGGWIDAAGQRLVDILMSLPGILLALVIAAGLGASLFHAALAIAMAIVPVAARVARASTLSVRAMPYVDAARALGAGSGRLVLQHVLPNAAAPILVIASVQLGFAILAEAALSFLGLGVPLGVPSWGSMLSGSALLYMQRAPWMGIFPGLALTLTVMAVNLFGDTLRDVLDPRLSGR
jgi:peptide/nickel transport system permease protein